MLKILLWAVSKDTKYRDNAIKILERQYGGVNVFDSCVGEDIVKVDWGGGYPARRRLEKNRHEQNR